jgi:ferredoxin
MLTTIEKLLFLVVVAVALYYAWRNFRLVYLVIRRGTGDFPTRQQLVGRLVEAGVQWLSLRPVWKTRTVASIFHGLVAAGGYRGGRHWDSLILAFLPYFPYTKHFHLIMSGRQLPHQAEAHVAGCAGADQLSRMRAIRSSASTRSRNCRGRTWSMPTRASCATAARMSARPTPPAKQLSPSALEINKRYYLNEHLTSWPLARNPRFSLIDYAISESAVWACTACGACVDICPVGNEPMFDIMYIRRHQMLMENAFPTELKQAYRGMERNGNPWNIRARDRMKWAAGIGSADDRREPGFRDCCGGLAVRPPMTRAPRTPPRRFAKVLNAAGVNYAVLGEMERCTGDSARRSGNEALFFELAQGNIETLNEVMGDKKRRIVTTCPHCLHTLGKEYSQYGGVYEVIHHTQLLSELTAAKKISVRAAKIVDMITFPRPVLPGPAQRHHRRSRASFAAGDRTPS